MLVCILHFLFHNCTDEYNCVIYTEQLVLHAHVLPCTLLHGAATCNFLCVLPHIFTLTLSFLSALLKLWNVQWYSISNFFAYLLQMLIDFIILKTLWAKIYYFIESPLFTLQRGEYVEKSFPMLGFWYCPTGLLQPEQSKTCSMLS